MGILNELGELCEGIVDAIDDCKGCDVPLGQRAEVRLQILRDDFGADGQVILNMMNALNPRQVHLSDPMNADYYVPYVRRFMRLWGLSPHKGSLKHVADCLAECFTKDSPRDTLDEVIAETKADSWIDGERDVAEFLKRRKTLGEVVLGAFNAADPMKLRPGTETPVDEYLAYAKRFIAEYEWRKDEARRAGKLKGWNTPIKELIAKAFHDVDGVAGNPAVIDEIARAIWEGVCRLHERQQRSM